MELGQRVCETVNDQHFEPPYVPSGGKMACSA